MVTATINSLKKIKQEGKRFTCLTAYDATFAATCEKAGIETILVGDSLGMVLQGHDSTVPVTTADMAYHISSVRKGAPNTLIIGDMPFMSYGTIEQGLTTAKHLMQAGAQVIKLEGGKILCPLIESLSLQGIPVCGHLGLTPQSVNKLGGYKVQGRDDDSAKHIIDDALALEAAGAEMLVLECIPAELAKSLTKALEIPTIGIGAGNHTDAQVLVLHDMLGLNPKPAKFVKDFMANANSIESAIEQYVHEVHSGLFPSDQHSFK